MNTQKNINQESNVFSRLHRNGINKTIFKRETNSSDVHLTESKEGYHIELEIVGYIKDDFNLYFNDDDLVLTTEKNKEDLSTKKSDSNILKHSYCYASAIFKKIFHLPLNVAKDKINFDYKNHVLSIDLFKLKAT